MMHDSRDHVKDFYAPLNGLVLAGGKSRRMGQDKALLDYHGVPQVFAAWQMLAPRVERCYVSARSGQLADGPYPQLHDRYDNVGPFAGILRAMEEHPEAAWLVVACDLPYLRGDVIENLIRGRSPAHDATVYSSRHDGLPEPLCAIWEPRTRARIYDAVEKRMLCPRKLLINSSVVELQLPRLEALDNCNTPEEFTRAKSFFTMEKGL